MRTLIAIALMLGCSIGYAQTTVEKQALLNDIDSIRSRVDGWVVATDPPTIPATPTDLAAESVTQTEVTITWTDNADNEVTYRVSRDGNDIATLPSGSARFTDSGLLPETVYTYMVVAANEAGDSQQSEPLEVTTLPEPPPPPPMGEVEVTPTHLITMHDTVPRFAASPDVTALLSGDWTHAATWGGTLPAEGQTISIPDGIEVTFDGSAVRHGSIEVSGTLTVEPTVNTQLICRDLTIMPNGSYIVGTPALPISSDVVAELVFTNNRHDLASDPYQHGNGLICFGTFAANGVTKTAFIRTGGTPTGWVDGDRLLVPDTRQIPMTELFPEFVSQAEELIYPDLAHSQESYAHIANLTRNVVFRSETPDDLVSRGHVIVMGNPTVQLVGAKFEGLGRTSTNIRRPVGTDENQVGRYSLHFHHVGHCNASVVNCVIEDTMRWGLVVHEIYDSTFTDNVFYSGRGNYQTGYTGEAGAMIMCESGNETGNMIARNFICHSKAGTTQRIRRAPGVVWGGIYANEQVGRDGIYCASGGNDLIDNVITNCPDVGINYNGHLALDTIAGFVEPVPIGEWRDNEIYGCTGQGLWVSYPQGRAFSTFSWGQPQTISDFTIRNMTHCGLYDYGQGTERHYKNFVIEFDPAVSAQSSGDLSIYSDLDDVINVGMWFGARYYRNVALVVENCNVTGANIGCKLPHHSDSGTLHAIKHSTFQGIDVSGCHVGMEFRPARFTQLHDVRLFDITFDPAAIPAGSSLPSPCNIWMRFDIREPHVNPVTQALLTLDGAKLYFYEQRADFVIPPYADTRGAINPDAPGVGLTNAEAWETLGIAIGNEVAPAEATDQSPTIIGLK